MTDDGHATAHPSGGRVAQHMAAGRPISGGEHTSPPGLHCLGCLGNLPPSPDRIVRITSISDGKAVRRVLGTMRHHFFKDTDIFQDQNE